LSDSVPGLHKAGNLVSSNPVAAFVIHQATSTCRSGDLEFKTYSVSFLRAANVALHT
jgi:hypothetical protein